MKLFLILSIILLIFFQVSIASNSNSTSTTTSNLSLYERLSSQLNPIPKRILENLKNENECDIYMALSSVPNSGRGIFAARDFKENEVLSISPSVPVPLTFLFTQLNWYVFASSASYSSFIFGPACIYNTMPTNYYNVDQIQEAISSYYSPFDNKEEINQNQVDDKHFYPYSISNFKYFVAKKPVKKGQELFVNYGDNWLVNHGITPDPTLYEKLFPLKGWEDEIKEIEKLINNLSENIIEEKEIKNKLLNSYKPPSNINLPGICMSNIMVDKSTLPLAGNGLYALKDFKKGELITISPVLLINLKLAKKLFFNSILMNYVISDPKKSDYGLFFIHITSMLNHSKNPNVSYKWFDWEEYERKNLNYTIKNQNIQLKNNNITSKNNFYNIKNKNLNDILSSNPTTLLNSPISNFDIGFYAEKNIKKGEELFINYGNEWEKLFNHYVENNLDCIQDILKDPYGRTTINHSNCYRNFIQPIEPPNDLFPLHWYRH